MTRQKRRQIFYFLLILFVILITAVILYVSGLRLDFAALKINKVGGIYLRSFPQNAQIYVDSRPVPNSSGIFQNSTFIGNLFPKSYDLKLSLGGYQKWEESASVLPGLVTEIKNAVLIPENASVVFNNAVKNFWILGDNPITEDGDQNLSFGGQKIGSGEVAGWTDDFQNILLHNPQNNVYLLDNLISGDQTNINSLLKKLGFNTNKNFKVKIEPKDKSELVVSDSRELSLFNTDQNKLAAVYKSKNTLVDKIAASQLFVALTEFNASHNTSTIIVYEKLSQKIRSGTPEISGANKDLEFIVPNKLALLQDDGELYIYDLDKNELQKVADDVKDFRFTSDGSAVAALENKSLEIFYFDQEHNYYRFNLPDINLASGVLWYSDKDHLFVVYSNRVKFLDVKDSSLKNFATVAETNLAQYDEKNNRLYFLDGSSLKALDFPK